MNKKGKSDATNRAYSKIKDMIWHYRLVPSQNISYIELSGALGMSQTPIINALHRLEQEEFVVSLPNRGFFIKEIDIKEVNELCLVQETLEIMAVEASVKHKTSNQLKELEKAWTIHRNHQSESVTREKQILDMIFHLKIAEMSNNNSLLKLIKHIYERIYLNYRSDLANPRRVLDAKDEHMKIFNAIKDGQSSLAKKFMRQHLRGALIAINKEAHEKKATEFTF